MEMSFGSNTKSNLNVKAHMKPEVFVDALKAHCCDSAVTDCVENFLNPPGRRPSKDLLEMSDWFKGLTEADRVNVKAAMQRAAEATLFGVLCVIDGVRVIEDEPEKSCFQLTATRSGVVSRLSPSEAYLHDLLKNEL